MNTRRTAAARTWLRRLTVLFALGAASCAGKTPQGGLEVVITTSGLRLGIDFDGIEGIVEQQTSPSGGWDKLFDIPRSVPDEITLPTTLAIRAGTSADQDALIEVFALKGDVRVVDRIVQTQVPKDRVAELKIVLSTDCLNQVGTCAAGESCQPTTGACGSNVVDVSTLPAYAGGDPVADGGLDATSSGITSDAASEASEAGPDASASAGCGTPWPGATGHWVSQPTGCTQGIGNQGTSACQAIPSGSTVPATASLGSPEQRGWWVLVPPDYDANKAYPVIYEGAGEGDPNFFHAGADGYAYQNVDNGEAIQVGLDYDTYSATPGNYDTGNPASNDLELMPWLMTEIESTFCVDTSREWVSNYTSAGPALTQQLDCALPVRLRGQVSVGGGEPGAPGYSGVLPTCAPAPMAALFVQDLNDPNSPYESILPGCQRILTQNGCTSSRCDPLDTTLTVPYPVPAGVTLPAGAGCAQFVGCPAAYPVVFCVTRNQSGQDDTAWGVAALFWDFIDRFVPPK